MVPVKEYVTEGPTWEGGVLRLARLMSDLLRGALSGRPRFKQSAFVRQALPLLPTADSVAETDNRLDALKRRIRAARKPLIVTMRNVDQGAMGTMLPDLHEALYLS